jgi:adenylate kinase
MNIILIGPQGSGKGTQAEKIKDHYRLYHLETGAIIRTEASKSTPKAIIIDHLVNKKGQLLPDGVVLDLIGSELEKNQFDQILFDGFPRTLPQYEVLKEFLEEQGKKINVAVYIKLTDEEAVSRLSARRSCKVCHRPYSVILEPQRLQCDCGGELIQRPDDQPEAIKARLSIFHEMTQPILDELKNDGVLVEVDGVGSVDEVFGRIVNGVGSSP